MSNALDFWTRLIFSGGWLAYLSLTQIDLGKILVKHEVEITHIKQQIEKEN